MYNSEEPGITRSNVIDLCDYVYLFPSMAFQPPTRTLKNITIDFPLGPLTSNIRSAAIICVYPRTETVSSQPHMPRTDVGRDAAAKIHEARQPPNRKKANCGTGTNSVSGIVANFLILFTLSSKEHTVLGTLHYTGPLACGPHITKDKIFTAFNSRPDCYLKSGDKKRKQQVGNKTWCTDDPFFFFLWVRVCERVCFGLSSGRFPRWFNKATRTYCGPTASVVVCLRIQVKRVRFPCEGCGWLHEQKRTQRGVVSSWRDPEACGLITLIKRSPSTHTNTHGGPPPPPPAYGHATRSQSGVLLVATGFSEHDRYSRRYPTRYVPPPS